MVVRWVTHAVADTYSAVHTCHTDADNSGQYLVGRRNPRRHGNRTADFWRANRADVEPRAGLDR